MTVARTMVPTMMPATASTVRDGVAGFGDGVGVAVVPALAKGERACAAGDMIGDGNVRSVVGAWLGSEEALCEQAVETMQKGDLEG